MVERREREGRKDGEGKREWGRKVVNGRMEGRRRKKKWEGRL